MGKDIIDIFRCDGSPPSWSLRQHGSLRVRLGLALAVARLVDGFYDLPERRFSGHSLEAVLRVGGEDGRDDQKRPQRVAVRVVEAEPLAVIDVIHHILDEREMGRRDVFGDDNGSTALGLHCLVGNGTGLGGGYLQEKIAFQSLLCRLVFLVRVRLGSAIDDGARRARSVGRRRRSQQAAWSLSSMSPRRRRGGLGDEDSSSLVN